MIEFVFLSALKIVCIHLCIKHEGNILFFIRKAGDEYWPVLMQKPIYDCLPCMSLLYGTLIYFISGSEVNYFDFILCLAGLLFIIDIMLGFLLFKLNIENGLPYTPH